MVNRLVYITTESLEMARRIGKTLVEERLAACANMWEPMHAVYWWKGHLEEDQEAVLLAKTREDLVPLVVDRVKALHPDEVPCIAAFPIDGGNPDFLRWIAEETRPAQG